MSGPSATLLLDRAGSGKTRRLLDSLQDVVTGDPLGDEVLLVVPPQATFDYERLVASTVGPTLRVRVLDPRRLVTHLLDGTQAAAMPEVDEAGRQLLVSLALRQTADQLATLRDVAQQPGTAAMVDAALGDLRAAEVDLDDFASSNDELSVKLSDLKIVRERYDALLDSRLDPAGRHDAAIATARSSNRLRWSRLYVDGFRLLTRPERRLLAAVAARAEATLAAFTCEADADVVGTGLFATTRASVTAFEAELSDAGVAVRRASLTDQKPRLSSAAIRLLERDAAQPRPSQAIDIDALEVHALDAADPVAEAKACVAVVKDWLIDGVSPSECAVLFRQSEQATRVLLDAAAEVGLPIFVDRRKPAWNHACVRLVKSVLACALDGWSTRNALALAKSRLAVAEASDAEQLELFVRSDQIRGRQMWEQAEPWLALEEDDAEAATIAERVRRRLVDAVALLRQSLDAERIVADHVAALQSVLEAFDVDAGIAAMAERESDRPEAADEHVGAWAAVQDLIGRLASLAPEASVDGETFAAMLLGGLDRLQFATTPPTAEAVVLADVERVVLPAGVKRAVVVGLSEGIFPQAGRDEALLDDGDRAALRQRGLDVPADDGAEERRLAYRAFTIASEQLVLLRPKHDASGRPMPESSFRVHARQLLGLDVETVERPVASERDATAYVLAKVNNRTPLTTLATHLYNAVRDGDVARRTWPSLSWSNRPALSEFTRSSLLGETLEAKVDRLEDFARCPFRHFAKHALSLPEPRPTDDAFRETALLTHDGLAGVVRDVASGRLDWQDAVAIERSTQFHVRRAAGKLRGGSLAETRVGRFVIARVTRTLVDVLAAQQAALSRGRMTPAYSDVRYGSEEHDALPPLELTTRRGRRVLLSGRIDRIDLARTLDGETIPCSLAIDYRSGSAESVTRNLRLGLSFGIVVHLLALQSHGSRLTPSPAEEAFGSLVVPSGRRMTSVDDVQEALDQPTELRLLRNKPRGIIDYDHLPLLDATFAGTNEERHEPGTSDAFAASITKAGLPSKRGSDVLTTEQMDGLVEGVRLAVVDVADGILDGHIEPKPFRIGKTTPCGSCGFRPLCRFETPEDAYRRVTPIPIPEADDDV
ncbi:MAG: PD-(D/E)XK nuclease family protein [Planctomycetota bacterium]